MSTLQDQIDSVRKLAIFASILKSPEEFFRHMNGHTTELSLVLRAFDIAENAEVIATALERSAEPTASEFLRKVKMICEVRVGCVKCPLEKFCEASRSKITDESDLVRKVMEYRLEDGE